ncbi:glycosyltransferase [uncultured Algoriphagus sp.]|uniref:glycosyltransferase n=1 Tax=uncultured Algoriphagus sp. TaxID=417365 RepID=UPI0030EDD140|tara:strand:+ start:52127 stop:53236 length:1110 start_codon:yes stop_codon:yes gene_type:complete
MISWFFIGILGLILIQFVVAIVRIHFFWKDHAVKNELKTPHVSILVAARNEEKDLPDLLESLGKLDYPSDRIQFLFVDDQSTDRTMEILTDWCGRNSNSTLLSIQPSQSAFYNDNGKANALAFLSEKATGDYYFFTDADCEVNPNWIREGINSFSGNTGMVIGITQVKTSGLFGRFQEIDWWLTLGFVKVATDLNMKTTGLGNNMVISKEAYKKSGGFKNLPFSLTEDLEISRAISRQGFKIAHQVSPGMLVFTNPESGLFNLLDQRKRWMGGVMTLPFYWKLILALQAAYFVALLGLILSNPLLGTGLGLMKIILQGIFLSNIAKRAGVKISWLYLLVFDFYNFNTTLLTILYYFWPSKTIWKSRIYP